MELVDQRLSDAECASDITFIYSYMVNCFKGAVTEMLASKACLQLIKHLQHMQELPANAQLYVGDAVRVHRAKGKGLHKGLQKQIIGIKVYCKLSVANLPNTLLQSTNRKTLRAGIDDQKGRRGAGHCT
jgi:hypothetical protein